ncbi:hypothetical protein [Arthrobacter sp. TWP1-1]|uniref:hypothetical protein n=1 Tax=Arthrobacter sp. TWP1-1 TaxID=2804568 RepID=UPI003CF2EF64
MDVIWIATALVVAVVGGWPVTAGILKFAKSKTVRAVDAAELGESSGLVQDPEPGAEAAVSIDAAGEPASDVPSDDIPSDDIPLENEPENASSETPVQQPKVEVLRGGLLIGFLERAAVAVAILAGQPVAIAYVVAIKGLGRYPELKDTPAASERFIIGTLASMLWSASVAVLTKTLLPIG